MKLWCAVCPSFPEPNRECLIDLGFDPAARRSYTPPRGEIWRVWTRRTRQISLSGGGGLLDSDSANG